MFGLMKRPPREPYCGTCKTMGERYGQKTRLLLNQDTVFLAELLQEYGGKPQLSAAFRSFNCMSMPKAADIPMAFDFAAAATIVLTHYRVADHHSDSGKRRWAFISRVLSPSYHKAASRLRNWEFPLDDLTQCLGSQSTREANPESLNHVAEPTAAATGMFFQHGVRLIGRKDLAETMYATGHRFGFLIYALDAYEDRTRDEKRGDFNPLLKFTNVDARAEILAATADVEQSIPPTLALRLRANVEERLGLRPRVLMHRCRKGVRARWKDAVTLARSIRKQEGALIFAAGCVAAFLVPHQMRSADSLRHGLGLGLNLMALGAVLSSAMPPPPPSGGYRPHVAVPPGSSSSGGVPTRGGAGGCCDCNNCGSCTQCCCTAECCGEGCCECCGSCGECGDCCSGCSC